MQRSLAVAAVLALQASPVFGEEEVVKREGLMSKECPSNCRCGDKHPTMSKSGHPMMECDHDVQGIAFKFLMPDGEYHGAMHWSDIPRYVKPKVLPPWNKASIMPMSFFNIKPGSIVLDIGASYGVFTLLVAKAFPDVKVIAVEPIGWVADLIEENARRNGVADRVKVFREPVTKDGRDITYYQNFFWQYLSNMHSKPVLPELHCDERTAKENPNTKTITIKDLIAKSGFDGPVSFVQVDCIGCEYEIGQEVADMNVPFSMRCWGGAENSKYASREWEELPSLSMFSAEDSAACLDLQDLGENRLLYDAADEGRPAEQALIGLMTLAEGNRTGAIQELAESLSLSATSAEMPVGGAREQYAIIGEALRSVAQFFVATALEGGEGMPQDVQAAAELFQTVAETEQRLFSLDADLEVLHEELPMLKDVMTGSMFRLGEILAKQGKMEEAKAYWSQASSLGHALAEARLDSFPETDFVGTNGLHKGHAQRQLMTQVRLEALGIPEALHQTLLGTAASEMFDECMHKSQGNGVRRWIDVFKGKGETFQATGAYRFRSWLHSAMGCWLAGQ